MRTLEDIHKNPAILQHLHWDLTPEQVFTPRAIQSKEDFELLDKVHKEQAGFYFYIDVWNCKASLALMHVKPDGSMTSERLSEFPEEALIEAIQEAGGAINMSGHYPINAWVKKMIRFMIPTKPVLEAAHTEA